MKKNVMIVAFPIDVEKSQSDGIIEGLISDSDDNTHIFGIYKDDAKKIDWEKIEIDIEGVDIQDVKDEVNKIKKEKILL